MTTECMKYLPLDAKQPTFCSKYVRWTSHLLLFPNRMVIHIVMLKKYFIEIYLCVIDSCIKDAFFKYVILHQNCVYTAVSIVHVSIKLSFIIIIIFVLKKNWCYICKTIWFFFSWQITCCISGNWYGMVCLMIAIFIGENLIILNLLNQGFLRNGLILSFQKDFFWRYQNLVVNCLLMTKDGFDSQLTHVSLCLTMALCTILYLNDGWVHRLS